MRSFWRLSHPSCLASFCLYNFGVGLSSSFLNSPLNFYIANFYLNQPTSFTFAFLYSIRNQHAIQMFENFCTHGAPFVPAMNVEHYFFSSCSMMSSTASMSSPIVAGRLTAVLTSPSFFINHSRRFFICIFLFLNNNFPRPYRNTLDRDILVFDFHFIRVCFPSDFNEVEGTHVELLFFRHVKTVSRVSKWGVDNFIFPRR